MRKIIKWAYLPLFIIGGNGIAISLVESNAPKYWLILLVLSLVVLSFRFEKLTPYDPDFNSSQQDEV